MEVNCAVVDAKGARDAREAGAHRPLPTKGLGVGRYRLLGADWRWGECQRATQRRRRGGARGGPGRAVVCAGVGAGGFGAWLGVLYMVWA